MKWSVLIAVAALLVAGCHHEHPSSEVPDVQAQIVEIMEWANGNTIGTAENGSINYYLQYVDEMMVKLRELCVFVEAEHGYDCKLPGEPPSGTNPPQGRPPTFP